MRGLFKTSFLMTVVLLVLCGVLYPAVITAAGKIFFPRQTAGSLIYVDGKPVGAEFIGQPFGGPQFMQSRPSYVGYNVYTEEEKKNGTYKGVSSGSANYAPSNPELAARTQKEIDAFIKANPGVKAGDIPADLVTASGSGLDPNISVQSALLQLPRLEKTTGLSRSELENIVNKNTDKKLFGIFGEDKVNVLKVNIEISSKMKQDLK